VEAASTWDSYKDALMDLLNKIKPKRVLEFGSGNSTKIFSSYESIEAVDSVESCPIWADKVRGLPKVQVILQESDHLYPFAIGRFDRYDLIMVDGAERPRCLEQSKTMLSDNGYIILHDAKREEYQESINSFEFIKFYDDGHTVILK